MLSYNIEEKVAILYVPHIAPSTLLFFMIGTETMTKFVFSLNKVSFISAISFSAFTNFLK